MCKTIKQKVKFKAPPPMVYELLVDQKKYSALTGKKAIIGKKIGDRFSVDSGAASGVIVDLLPGKRIVRAWRGKDFPPGIYSMATFVLTPTRDGGTELVLTHRGVPKEIIPQTESNWRDHCWNKMKAYLTKK